MPLVSVSNPAVARIVPADVRNVMLCGHNGCGKTTLIDRLLFENKNLNKMGSTGEGTLVCDYEAEEKLHKHSLKSAMVHFMHDRRLFNVIDTPGSADFLGHAISAFPAVESLLIVIDAAKGIEVTTRRIMRLAGELRMPRMIVVNKIDQEGVDLAGVMASIREAFGQECLAVNLPIRENTDVIDVLDHGRSTGGVMPTFSSVEEAHKAIIEQVVEMDEELTGEYFEHPDQLDAMKLHRAFEKAMEEGHLVPVMFCSGKTGAGIADLMHVIAEQAPSPVECTPPVLMFHDGQDRHTFKPQIDPAAPAIAHVFKIINDPFLGKLAIFRVVQGTIKAKTDMLHGESKKPIRLAHLYKLCGKEHVEVDHVVAGDIGVVPKIDELRYNSILHENHAHDMVSAPDVPLPKPLYGMAVELKNHADEAKFAMAVHKLSEEDPCFVMERIAATGQTVLRGLGELHLRVAIERLKSRYGVELTTKPMKVAYRETIAGRADGHYRHKKQTGGAGQFGEVYLRVEPLTNADGEAGPADGFEFVNDTVGGAVPRQFMPAIEKGCRPVLATGAFAGYPLTGIRVSVYDGKYHDVDSKEIAFLAAGKRAFIDAVLKAKPVLLEPYVVVEITAPQESMGDITAQLSGKRSRIESSDLRGDMCVIRAVAPLAELMTYSSELKSITSGQGTYTMDYSHDDRTPPAVQATIMAAYKPKSEED